MEYLYVIGLSVNDPIIPPRLYPPFKWLKSPPEGLSTTLHLFGGSIYSQWFIIS